MLSRLKHVLDNKTLRSIYYVLNPIYVRFLSFGLKTLIQVKDIVYYRKKPSEFFFQSRNSHTDPLTTPKLLSESQNSHRNHSLMIRDGQFLVTFKLLFTEQKPLSNFIS